MSKPIRQRNGHLGFPSGLKNTNLVENIDFLLPVRLRFVQQFQRSLKCHSESEAGWPLCFLIDLKSTNLVEDILFLLQFRQNPFR